MGHRCPQAHSDVATGRGHGVAWSIQFNMYSKTCHALVWLHSPPQIQNLPSPKLNSDSKSCFTVLSGPHTLISLCCRLHDPFNTVLVTQKSFVRAGLHDKAARSAQLQAPSLSNRFFSHCGGACVSVAIQTAHQHRQIPVHSHHSEKGSTRHHATADELCTAIAIAYILKCSLLRYKCSELHPRVL